MDCKAKVYCLIIIIGEYLKWIDFQSDDHISVLIECHYHLENDRDEKDYTQIINCRWDLNQDENYLELSNQY